MCGSLLLFEFSQVDIFLFKEYIFIQMHHGKVAQVHILEGSFKATVKLYIQENICNSIVGKDRTTEEKD